MANTDLVYGPPKDGHCNTNLDLQQQTESTRDTENTSISTKNDSNSRFMFQKYSSATNIPSDTERILSAAWRNGTSNKYKGIIQRFKNFCSEKQTDESNVDTSIILEFLTKEFQRGLKYSTLRSTLSALGVITQSNQDRLIKVFMKGVYNLRPPRSKYHAIWDPKRLLDYLEHMKIDSLMAMSKKTTFLLMLLAGQRVNILSNLKILNNMYLTDLECTFVFDDVLKHSRPNLYQKPLTFRSFPGNLALCPVNTIKQYLEYRLTKSSDSAFFITTTSPYKKCSSDTIARWIKTTMAAAGIYSGLFQAHSIRSASTSAAKRKGVSLSTIISSAFWSSDSTFKKHYDKELAELYETIEPNMGTMLLSR